MALELTVSHDQPITISSTNTPLFAFLVTAPGGEKRVMLAPDLEQAREQAACWGVLREDVTPTPYGVRWCSAACWRYEKPWRDATKQDVIDSLSGAKKFEVRVKDDADLNWHKRSTASCLVGYREKNEYAFITNGSAFRYCQVREVE